MLTHVGGTLRSDLAGENWTKSIDPHPYALMANIDTTLVKQVFYTAKRKRKPTYIITASWMISGEVLK